MLCLFLLAAVLPLIYPPHTQTLKAEAHIIGGRYLKKEATCNNNKRPLTPKSMPPAGDQHAKLKT